MVYSTHKSRKIVLDTKQNFLLSMRDHYEKDEIVTPEIVRKAELNLNNYLRSWSRIFNIGAGSGSGQAI